VSARPPLYDEECIGIRYYVDGKRFAERHRRRVPQVGDEVRLNGVAYSVTFRIWLEDEAEAAVAIDLERVKEVE
jgi:hypothetical protein